jgi:MFS family permease
MTVGGGAFAAGLVALAAARSPLVILVAMCVLYPASGAFVSLSQATLMDVEPADRDLAMNRWTIAGGIGVLAGPAVVAASIGAGLGWRIPFMAMALLSACLVAGLRRMPGATYLRASAAAAFLVYPAVLVAPGAPAKVAAAAGLGVLTCGWYPLLKASLYDELPGWSGAATALSSVSSALAGLLPLGLGLLAGRYGIAAAIWALLAGPAGLLLLLPRRP